MSYINESASEREARIKRFQSLTDEEIEAAIAGDPDAQVPIEALRQTGGYMAYPDGLAIIPVKTDVATACWLNSHQVDYHAFLADVLKAYVESQQKHS